MVFPFTGWVTFDECLQILGSLYLKNGDSSTYLIEKLWDPHDTTRTQKELTPILPMHLPVFLPNRRTWTGKGHNESFNVKPSNVHVCNSLFSLLPITWYLSQRYWSAPVKSHTVLKNLPKVYGIWEENLPKSLKYKPSAEPLLTPSLSLQLPSLFSSNKHSQSTYYLPGIVLNSGN